LSNLEDLNEMKSPASSPFATYIFIGIGGMIGAAARYSVSLWAAPVPGFSAAVGTLISNLAGCFLLGLLAAINSKFLPNHGPLRVGITTGCIGSFTTYSAFSVEAVELLKSGQVWLALNYILISGVGGLLLAGLGWVLIKKLVRITGVQS
jgi:CrcB protein